MSDKRRTPESYDGSSKLTDFIDVKLNNDFSAKHGFNLSGKPSNNIRIHFSKDKNNNNVGRIVEVEWSQFGTSTTNLRNRKTVTDEKDLKLLRENPIIQEAILEKLKKIASTPEGKKALKESGLLQFATEETDMSEFPFKSEEGGTQNEKDPTPGQFSPKELIANYKDIFKNNLKYPIDMFVGDAETEGEKDSGSQDYIYFEQFTYKPPQEGRDLEADGSGRLKEASVRTAFNEGIGRNQSIKEAQGTCMLPIPNKLGISQGVNWGESKVNALEFAAFNAASNSVANVASNNPFSIFTEINNLRKQGGAVLDTVFQGAAKGQTNQATSASIANAVVAKALLSRLNINVDVDQFITRQTGAAINPNLELLFAGPQLRTFSFQFNFAPNGKKEASEVRKIQRWFREGMLATKTNISNTATLFLGSPNVFRICYKNNSRRIKGLNTFKICALTSCEIDFTPDGVYQSYEDGFDDGDGVSMPVRSQMALTFSELTPIFRNDYGSGGDEFNPSEDPTLKDVDVNISGDNKFTEDDLGF